jgi:hypothetical protein
MTLDPTLAGFDEFLRRPVGQTQTISQGTLNTSTIGAAKSLSLSESLDFLPNFDRLEVALGQLASKITANDIEIGTITGDNIEFGAITGDEISAGAISATLIEAGTITSNEIAANTITAGNIAASTITSTQIAAGTILATNIAAGTITAAQIQAGTITANEIAANTITANKIQAGTITGTEIAASVSLSAPTITGGTITGNTITGSTITGATVTGGVLQTATSGTYINMDGTDAGRINFYVGNNLIGKIRATASLFQFWGQTGYDAEINGETIRLRNPVGAGTTADVDSIQGQGGGTLSVQSLARFNAALSVRGTGGAAFIETQEQSSAPSTPASGLVRIYIDSSQNLKVRRSNGQTATVTLTYS